MRRRNALPILEVLTSANASHWYLVAQYVGSAGMVLWTSSSVCAFTKRWIGRNSLTNQLVLDFLDVIRCGTDFQ